MKHTRQVFTLTFAAILSTTLAAPSFGALPPIDWLRQLGSSDDDRYPDIAVDNLGHTFIAGTTDGSLARPANIYDDAFLAQYSTSGNLNWVRQFGISSTSAFAVAADQHGSAYVTGDTRSSVGIPYDPGFEDAFVAKYDSSGSLQWNRQIGIPAQESGKDVAVDGLGNVYVAGYATGPLNGQAHNGFGFDAFLIKLHDDGTVEWTREFGGSGNDVAWEVAADPLGNVYVSGYTEDVPPGQFDSNYDAFLSKYDAAGNLQWSRKFGTTKNEEVESMALDAAGNVYLGGNTHGNLSGTDPSPGPYGAAFLAKFTPEGVAEWLRQFNAGTFPTALAVDTLNNLYASNLGPSSLISKLDADGNLIWTYPVGTLPGTQDYRTWSAAVDNTGSLYLSGGFPGYATSAAGFADVFVLKISDVPEPSTIALTLITSFAALPIRMRRNAKPGTGAM